MSVRGDRLGDRLKLVTGARLLSSWRRAIAIVQPETVVRWHRAGFRLFWRQRSRPRKTTQRRGGIRHHLAPYVVRAPSVRLRVTQAVACEALRDARALLDCEARIAFEQLLRELRPFAWAP